MICCSSSPAKLKTRSSKVQAKAHVECHIRVICMHIEAQIFAFQGYDMSDIWRPKQAIARLETIAIRSY